MSITWLTDAGGLAEPVQVDSSAKESVADDKISCTVQLRCPWAKRYDVVDNILLNAKAWPYHTTPVAFATSCEIANAVAPSIANGSGLDYAEALLDFTFETINKKDDSDTGDTTIYDESFEPTAEFLQISPSGFYWDNAQTELIKKEEAPGRLVISLDYCVTISNLSLIPDSVLNLIGKVNDHDVVSPSLGVTFVTESLLFNPPKISRKVTVKGDNKFTMQCRYTYRKDGWNKFWRAGTVGDWGIIYDKTGTQYKNYHTASFVGMVP